MPNSSSLPKDYVSLGRAKKLELLWDCITSSAYQGSLPTELPGKLELLQLLRVDYDRVAIEHDGDELPEGRVKLTHRYGAVSRVRLELTHDHGFTGMFGHGAEAIFRYSEATGGDEPLSSFALKLLVDGHPSVNLLFLPMIAREDDPASDDPNPFARAYCTVTTGATNLQGAAIPRAFDATADAVDAPRLRAIRLPLHDVAAIDPTGAVAEHSVVPDRVELHPCPEAISAGHGYATWREVLGRIPAGTPLFELRLAREDGGEALPWARLTVGSGFVFSRYGDERLFFQHHAGPSTASLVTGEPFGPAIERLGPPRLSLPQNDRDAPGRDRTLEAARDEYRYTYAKPNIRGLAMVEELPRSASPRPGWIEQVVEVTLALARNTQREADEEGSAVYAPAPPPSRARCARAA